MFQRIKTFFLENKNKKQIVIKNTVWLAGSTLISRLIRALMVIYAARVLGTAGYGVFSYAISIAGFFAIFADIGLTGLLTREAAKKPDKISEYISTISVFKLLLVSVTALLIIFVAPYFVTIPEARAILPIVALILVLDNLRHFSFSIARANNRMETEGMLDMATELLITVFGFIVLIFLPSTYNLTLAYALGGAIGLLLIIITVQKQFAFSIRNFNRSLIRPIFSSSWPFALLAVFSSFMTNIDSIILGWYEDAHELGLFAAALRPISILYLIPGFINSSLIPIFSQLVERGDHQSFKNILEKAVTITTGLALPFVAGGIILTSSIMSLLYGAAYADAIPTFKVLLLTLLAVFPGMIIGTAAYTMDLQKIFIRASALGAVGNIVLDVLLIPVWGIVGSAIATVVAQCIMNGYNFYQIKKITHFSLKNKLTNIVIATILMSGVIIILQMLHVYILIIIALGILVYLGTLILLREKILREFLLVLRN